MFERFTEKAINAIAEAQSQAKAMNNVRVQPEHLLLAIVKQSKGIPQKLFRINKITFDEMHEAVEKKLRFEKNTKTQNVIPFSDEFKDLLKHTLDLAGKSGNSSILFEHLFLVAINEKSSYNKRILEQFNFDFDNANEILLKLVQKKIKKSSHPEIEDVKDSECQNCNAAEFSAENFDAANLFEEATKFKLEKNLEMIGTEQILASILKNDSELKEILVENGINPIIFEEKLSFLSREQEYDNKKILFTPAASTAMNQALQTAKEVGSSKVKPEHIVLGILKAKKGLAYEVFKSLNIDDDELAHNILKPIEKQMPQALTIMRFAKQEARRLGRNVVGTEMLLLGIISEGMSVGFKVLSDLEITLKDVRQVVEKIIGYGNEYYDKEIIFTKRAKKVLETAWLTAKKYKKPRIMSEHLLYAITKDTTSVAMKALENLGVDAVEIRQGILKEIEG